MTDPMVSKGPSISLYSAGVDDLPLTIGLLVMGYLIGSLPMGVIVARLTGGTDPRTVGSGRTGGTNALRAMGWGRAITVGLLDLAKGAVPILIARALGAPIEVQALTGVAAVLGAWKSVFLRFHGGRGVATGVGGMLVVSPLVCLIAAPAFFIIIGVTRYVSLGSLLGTAFGAAVAILFVLAGGPGAGLAALRAARRWPSSGSRIATTSGACWPARSAASTLATGNPRPRRTGSEAAAAAAAPATGYRQPATGATCDRGPRSCRPRGSARSTALTPARRPGRG